MELMSKYIDSLIEGTKGPVPSWNKESFKGKWNYIDGVFLNSIVNLYNEIKDTDVKKANYYKDFLIKFVDYYIDDYGNFVNLKFENQNGYSKGELDSVCESRILFDLYEMTNNEKYLKAIEHTYNYLILLPRAVGSENFWHKTSYPNQIWLDGLYMYVPFYLRYSLLKNKPEIFDEVKRQYEYVRKNAFDENKKLYYHGIDTSKEAFWANKKTGCSKNFWGRSLGWFLVSLVDSIEYYENGSNKDYLLSILKEGIDGVLQYQDKNTKLFYQLIDLGDKSFTVKASYLESLENEKYSNNGNYVDVTISNYIESSASAMYAYVAMKGARLGYFDSSYMKKGKEIFEGIFNNKLFSDGNGIELRDICITAGLGPDEKPFRDGTVQYYLAEPVGSNDAKGVGPFIMAYIEYDNK